MRFIKSSNFRSNFRYWCDVIRKGDVVVISRPRSENIVMMSERCYSLLMQRNEQKKAV